MLNYLNQWMEQLKWQRLVPFQELAEMLLKHVDGIANYCETKVRFGVVEAVKCEHSDADQPWSRVSKSPLPAPEGQADGGDQRRIHCRSHG